MGAELEILYTSAKFCTEAKLVETLDTAACALAKFVKFVIPASVVMLVLFPATVVISEFKPATVEILLVGEICPATVLTLEEHLVV